MTEVILQVESSVQAPSVSRSRLATMKEALEPCYENVLLLVSELVSNSVRHSFSDEIDICVRANGKQIRVEVIDDGPGFTEEAPRGDGLGLTIVEKLSDRWGLTSGDRFTVWAELARTGC